VNRHRHVLVVEGSDDRHVVCHVVARHGFDSMLHFPNAGSVDRALRAFAEQVAAPGPEAVGLVVDADQGVAPRWQRLTQLLAPLGYRVPPEPDAAGTVLESADDRPRVGVWLMPDNRRAGALEDFLRDLIPPGDALLTYAQACLAALPERRFPAVRDGKALTHTWLAWQPEPGHPYGTAIRSGYLDAGRDPAAALASWCVRLFTPPPDRPEA
jgi:hypothetical protein